MFLFSRGGRVASLALDIVANYVKMLWHVVAKGSISRFSVSSKDDLK